MIPVTPHFKYITNLLNRVLLIMGMGILSAGFLSCRSSGSKINGGSDTMIRYSIPEPPPLDRAESLRLHAACESWYDTVLKVRGFNGGILVARKGQVVFERYSGTGHLPGQDTIRDNTPLQIASITKTFTAMAVLKLVQDGNVQLDDELARYFPSFHYAGVTIRNLLNHRSGLPNYTHFMENMGWDKTRFVTNEDVLEFLISRKADMVNVAPPDHHFSYCNTNYALLALLIEKVTGKKYAEYLQQVFFTPLNMKNTYVFSLKDTGTALPSYDWKGRLMPFGFLDGVYGDKNIYTTVRDLLKWDHFLNSGACFTPETLEQAYAPYSNEKPGIRNYGLGWRMNIYPEGKKIIYHNGWWHGSNASFIRLLKDSATIIVIGNRFTRAVYHARSLANLFGDYYGPEEEEDLEPNRSADSLNLLLPAKDSVRVNTKKSKTAPVSRKKDVPATKRKVRKN